MNTEKYCKKCKRSVHCCIFNGSKDESGFAFVGIRDAKKIKKFIKKDYSYFLNYSPLPKSTINLMKKEDPILEGMKNYSLLDKNNCLLRMKTKKDGRCIFLNDKGKCDIYKVRPNICRIFPFWVVRLINGRLKIIAHDVYPECSIICDLRKKDRNLEKNLSKKDILFIKNTFKAIEKEAVYYKKNIRRFERELS